MALVVAITAGLFVTFFKVDLGRFPTIQRRAEAYATNYLGRPMHIGGMHLLMQPGKFEFNDVVIEGRHPGDRPFFRAKRLVLSVPWWSIIGGTQLYVDLQIYDWQMTVETFADGHNIPRLTPPKSDRPPRELWFKTTVNVNAHSGSFVYDDHVTPWRVSAPNLQFDLVRSQALPQYVGHAMFFGGEVQMLSYRPMKADMSLRFILEGTKVDLTHIDLVTDGAVSHVNGVVDFAKWPEQRYNVNSTVDFARMKEIFFANEKWRLAGTGQFTGVFLFSKDNRDLSGEFESEDAEVAGLAFPHLHGALQWTRDKFVVSHADSDLLGGSTRFSYSMAPLGLPGGSEATFSADYADIDLGGLEPYVDLMGLRLAGRASGTIEMQWPTGKFGTGKVGHGHTIVAAPAGVTLATADLPSTPRTPSGQSFDRPLGTLNVAADVHYEFDANGWTFEPGWAATPYTYVAFSGRMAGNGGAAEFPFHVTSHDWQESDRVLAGIMTAVTRSETGAIEVAGRGTFDGRMTGTFSAPVITGRFDGLDTRVWGVTWGRATGDLVIENKYVTITNSRIGDDKQSMVANGRYSLGFRNDDADEIAAHVTITNWPLADFRTAFQLTDWPMDATVGMAELDLRRRYKDMFGSGKIRLDKGIAWNEHFDTATADLQLEGSGMLVNRIEMSKGPGVLHGAARIGWRDNTYAFNADGSRIPVESLDHFKFETTPLSGTLAFKANGAGTFDAPTYDFEIEVPDMFIGDEGIGVVSGRATIAKNVMTIERLAAASSRLDVFGSGTVALNDESDADLRFRFQRTSLEPYLKFVAPSVSPYTRLIAGGLLVMRGPLSIPEQLLVDATIDDAALTLFDYSLTNDGDIRLTYEDNTFKAGRLRLKGEGTSLGVAGEVDMGRRTVDLSASGDASLAVLQLTFPGMTASGGATLNAAYRGPFNTAELTGEATIANGRLRPISSPHSLEAINGRITFDRSGINLDDMTGRIGQGEVDFGGSIGLDGYKLTDYALTATGRSMQLRYPAGLQSTVNMDLVLTGNYRTPRLSGEIEVIAANFRVTSDSQAGLLGGLTAGGTGLVSAALSAAAPLEPETTPVVLDIHVTAPRTPFINDRKSGTAVYGTADLYVRGTFDRPIIQGTLDILDGQLTFQGNRINVGEGTISFTNPDKLEPVFDLAAETRVRASGQTYNITIHFAGTMDRFMPEVSADPWLSEPDIWALLMGGLPVLDNPEQRALRSPQENQAQMIQTAAAMLLMSPISSRVGEVFEQMKVLDTVQIALLNNAVAFQQLNPSARITLGKRISNRVYLTYSRTYGDSAQDEIILIEYDQSDRLSWVLSRNEDRTLAIDFRIRFVF